MIGLLIGFFEEASNLGSSEDCGRARVLGFVVWGAIVGGRFDDFLQLHVGTFLLPTHAPTLFFFLSD